MIEHQDPVNYQQVPPRNPIEEWSGAIKEEVGDWSAALILGIVLLPLFAPIFGPFMEQSLMEKYGANSTLSLRPLVYQKMKRIYFVLWSVAILAWIGLFVIGITWNWQY